MRGKNIVWNNIREKSCGRMQSGPRRVLFWPPGLGPRLNKHGKKALRKEYRASGLRAGDKRAGNRKAESLGKRERAQGNVELCSF